RGGVPAARRLPAGEELLAPAVGRDRALPAAVRAARRLLLLVGPPGVLTGHPPPEDRTSVEDMGSREFRIKVRGEFKDLSDQQRSDLLAGAAEHDPLSSAFTPEGHLAYDLAARPFFTFRFADSGETDADLVTATA